VSQKKTVDAFNTPKSKEYSRAIKVTKNRENIPEGGKKREET
jgi:hypothetical protein